MAYLRRTVWSSAQPLTAADLNAEFDAIAAAIQELGSGGGGGGGGGIEGEGLVVNAGHPDFNPGGSDAFAERVQNAVAEAVASQRKVVWVPKWMWGYAEDSEWDAGNFDDSVLVVREGGLYPVYDPIAYGAKINDASFNNRPVFELCFDHAEAADGPGASVVAVTVPGAYQVSTALPRPTGVALWELPGVTYTGVGMTGAVSPQDFPAPRAGYTYDWEQATAAQRRGSPTQAGQTLVLFMSTDTNENGVIGVNLTDFHSSYDTTKVLAAVALPWGGAARTVENASIQTDAADDWWYFRVRDAAGATVDETPVNVQAIIIMAPIE